MYCGASKDVATLVNIPTPIFLSTHAPTGLQVPVGRVTLLSMQSQPHRIIIQSTFFGFQAYATSLPDVVVTGKNVPEVKAKLRAALQDHFRTSGHPALSADITYHIVY